RPSIRRFPPTPIRWACAAWASAATPDSAPPSPTRCATRSGTSRCVSPRCPSPRRGYAPPSRPPPGPAPPAAELPRALRHLPPHLRVARPRLREGRAHAGIRAEGGHAGLRRAVGVRALPRRARPLRGGVDVAAALPLPRGGGDQPHPA